MKKILKSVILFFPVLLLLIFFIRPFIRSGLIVGSDWVFPYSQNQLAFFGSGWNTLWNFGEIPTGTQTPHKNLFLFELLAKSFSLFGSSGIFFEKTFVLTVLILICLTSFIFFKKITKNYLAAYLGTASYLLSPVVFNYFNMGWQFVLLFMAIMPLFSILWIDFMEKDKKSSLIFISILYVVAFLQSQSIFWLPVLSFVLTLSFLPRIGIKNAFLKLLIGNLAMILLLIIVHGSWLLPISLFSEKYLTSGVSSNDLFRFNQVDSLKNQIIGWGSLYNQHFELSFDRNLKAFAYFPIIVLILLGYRNSSKLKNGNNGPFVILALLLVLISPVFFLIHQPIAGLPLSNIIRDSSRFIIFTNFGFSIGIALYFSQLKKVIVKIVFILLFLLSIHPYLTNRLLEPRVYNYGASEFSKDQRIRNLIVPENEIESDIAQYQSHRNLFIPFGGSVNSLNDKLFSVSFSWITDFDSLFSPFGSGIYISDKSNPKLIDFASNFVYFANKKPIYFENLARIQGISHIFIRKGLKSTNEFYPGSDFIVGECKLQTLNESDWSISKICSIKNPYPLIYVSSQPIFESKESFYKNLINYGESLTVSVDCSGDKVNCMNEGSYGSSNINITYKKLGTEKYLVNVSGVKTDYILALNYTFHPGWVLKSSYDERKIYKKVLVNQMVNGWSIPYSGENNQFIIEFYPDILYRRLLPISIGSLLVLLIVGFRLLSTETKKNA